MKPMQIHLRRGLRDRIANLQAGAKACLPRRPMLCRRFRRGESRQAEAGQHSGG
jgi:hypothetical protein